MISSPLLLGDEGGYQISRSVRLRSSASAYFNQTPASVGNRRTWTWSTWVKRGIIGDGSLAFAGTLNATTSIYILFTGEVIAVYGYNTSTLNVTWNVYLRDPSAWYHIVVAFDTTQATASNRVKLYINNQQITGTITATYPGINTDWDMGNNTAQYLGRRSDGSYSLDTYLTEINYINGQQLTPSSFGETNAVTGVWQPKKYAGTYGTNGYYLNFSDNSNNTAATIGKDNSGNGNNWTPNNISVTAGATYDSMLDVPTLYADGGNGRGNYATLNPLATNTVGVATLSNANLNFSIPNTFTAVSTMSASSGKYYWEAVATSSPIGIGLKQVNVNDRYSNSIYYMGSSLSASGEKYVNGTGSAYGASWTTNDVIGVAVDMGAGTVTFYKNNVSQGAITLSSATITEFVPSFVSGAGATFVGFVNFGQRPFTYTPPTGFKALNTQNLPDATIKKGNAYFDATTYTGNGTTLSVVNNGGFEPDLIWIKSRSNALTHKLTNSVVGIQKALSSDSTAAESSDTGGVTAFNSNGFTIGTTLAYNTNAATYVAWQWDAGTTTVTNTSGSISAQVRASPTAGFSVVTWTGTTASSATIGHGLGVTPTMIIVKNRSRASTLWCVYTSTTGNTKALNLNDTSTGITDIGFWNNTNPTSTVFTTGNGYAYYVGGIADNYVAYCFAAVAGYSAFGSYTGNGSADGPFVFLGFRPRFVMVKLSSAAGQNWEMWDSSRGAYNIDTPLLYANLSNAETAGNAARFDALSNGFKIRSTNAGVNTNAATYIYMAFCENPFKLSLAR